MSDRFLKILPWFLSIIVLGNLLFLDFFGTKGRSGEDSHVQTVTEVNATPIPLPSITATNNNSNCPAACNDLIKSEVAKVVLLTPTNGQNLTPTPGKTVNNPKSLYVGIFSSLASTVNMDWTDIEASDFYLDLNDYPGVTAVRWEISLKAINGSALVYARLYDVTNKRGVDYSELSTQSGSYALLRSGDLRIWQGNNLYRVQLRSLNGTETDAMVARLKIIY